MKGSKTQGMGGLADINVSCCVSPLSPPEISAPLQKQLKAHMLNLVTLNVPVTQMFPLTTLRGAKIHLCLVYPSAYLLVPTPRDLHSHLCRHSCVWKLNNRNLFG